MWVGGWEECVCVCVYVCVCVFDYHNHLAEKLGDVNPQGHAGDDLLYSLEVSPGVPLYLRSA